MEIVNERVGKFTSSEIYRLMTEGKVKGTFGKPALSYIQEKKYERKLKRSLGSEAFSYPTSWGQLMEGYANSLFNLLSFEYEMASKDIINHPTIPSWSGSPDLYTSNTVSDLKCPFTMKSFCELVEACSSLETFKSEYPEYYWQLVSNSILTNKEFIELIVFCPFKSEFLDLSNYIDDLVDEEKMKYEWVYNAILYNKVDKLPYLMDDSDYINMNIFRFVPMDGDRELLVSKILIASELL